MEWLDEVLGLQFEAGAEQRMGISEVCLQSRRQLGDGSC
jgi:hypothetical protein